MERYFISAPNQEYTTEFLRSIKENDLVVYDGRGCHAVRIIPRKGCRNPLLEILEEDDGNLFSCDSPFMFDLFWTTDLINQLADAMEYWSQIKNKYTQEEVVDNDCAGI